jgi:hypothetical protein
VTHFLLSALIARPLHTRLSPPIALVVLTLSSGARTALEFNATSLPLIAPPGAWPDAASRAGCPTTQSSLAPFHSSMRDIAEVARFAFDDEGQNQIGYFVVLALMVVRFRSLDGS